MIGIYTKLPDISQNMQHIQQIQLSTDVTVIFVFKTMFRDDDVLFDLYLNEIADSTKIVSGKKMNTEALLVQPNYDIGFNYYVYCANSDGIQEDLNRYNMNKFYLQFTYYDNKEWNTTEI